MSGASSEAQRGQKSPATAQVLNAIPEIVNSANDPRVVEQGWRGTAPSRATKFWGCRIGSRLTFPIDFLQIGVRNAAASTLVRETMIRRFHHVGEALVYFDIDDVGSLTRAQMERGLARMGLLADVNSEQLICEVNGVYNGKLSNVAGDHFMRHFHWGEVAYDKQLGAALYSTARGSRQEIYARGRPPAAARLGKPDHASRHGPRPPAGARAGESAPRARQQAACHVSLAELRKIRVGQAIQDSARLSVISNPYIRAEASLNDQVPCHVLFAMIWVLNCHQVLTHA